MPGKVSGQEFWSPKKKDYQLPGPALRGSIGRIFHFNLNVKDWQETLDFYAMFGFKAVPEFLSKDPEGATGTEMNTIYSDNHVRGENDSSTTTLHFRHMRLGDRPEATRIDVVQWVNPPVHNVPDSNLISDPDGDRSKKADLTHTGIARISLFVDNNFSGAREPEALEELNIFKWHKRLREKGVRFYNDPDKGPVEFGELSGTWILPFYDPNGIVLQLLQGNL